MSEYIIENITRAEKEKLYACMDIEWYPDDLYGNDICVYGTESNVTRLLKLIGR